MKNLKRVGVLLLTAAMAVSAVGCGAGGRGGSVNKNSKLTTIEFCNFLGCSGDKWIKQAAARFADLKKEKSYEEGKKGVEIKVAQEKNIPFDSIDQSGYDIFVGENKVDVYSMSNKKFLLNLDDIVKPLEGKIADNVLEGLKGADGSYYSLPHYSWYTGISYDVNFFEEENLYFAAPNSPTATPIENQFFLFALSSNRFCQAPRQLRHRRKYGVAGGLHFAYCNRLCLRTRWL